MFFPDIVSKREVSTFQSREVLLYTYATTYATQVGSITRYGCTHMVGCKLLDGTWLYEESDGERAEGAMVGWGEVIDTRERGRKGERENEGCGMGEREGEVGESENGEEVEYGT